MGDAAAELERAIELMEHAKLELDNAAGASKTMASSFLGDADRFLIDANAAVWRACSELGCDARPVPDSSRSGESDPRRAAKATLTELAEARADVGRLLQAVRTGSALPVLGTSAPTSTEGAVPAPAGDDPFGTAAHFDPKNSLKHVTRMRGIKLLVVGLAITALGVGLGLWVAAYTGVDRVWLAFPLLGLAIAGKGFIEILHSRDM